MRIFHRILGRDFICDYIWNLANIEDGFIDILGHVPKAGSVRKTLEVIVRSMFFREMLVSETIHKQIKPGYHQVTARVWGQIWAGAGEFKLLMNRLIDSSNGVYKMAIEDMSKDLISLSSTLEAKRVNVSS